MAAVSDLPNVETILKHCVEVQRLTHEQISIMLKEMYPSVRGLSALSVRRFCKSKGIHKTSRLDDGHLDHLVGHGITKVGSSYGRKMMKGYLAASGIHVAENRIGLSLRRMDPSHHVQRARLTQFQINPRPYTASYFGNKIHIDQNEKMVMFGATHVAAIDGKILLEFGLWDQVRIDMGREWTLIMFVQDLLSRHRTNSTIRPYVSSCSKNNHTIERLWVEVNSRVNYPIKRVLIEMSEDGDIAMDDPLHKFCSSWFTIQVANSGMELFVTSWNNHPLPGRKDGLCRGVPNERMSQNNNAKHLDRLLIPSPIDAVRMYTNSVGGTITMQSSFGLDPLANNIQKKIIREQYFQEKCPPFVSIFSAVVNGNGDMFKENLLLFIDISRRLALT